MNIIAQVFAIKF